MTLKTERTLNLLMAYAVLLGLYMVLVWLTEYEFETTHFFVLTNLLTLWVLYKAPQSMEVEVNPLKKLAFTESEIVLGDIHIAKEKISKVVVDIVKPIDGKHEQGLFQLPFNYHEGKIPEMWFDPKHTQGLKEYIATHLPDVAFIK